MGVTLRDVARRSGVHPSTVSRALDPAKAWLVNPETRERVQAAAATLGYRRDLVASGLRRGRSATVAVVVADLGNPYIAPVVRGIENTLDGRGTMTLIAETRDDPDRFDRVFDHLLGRRVDAVITTAARTGSAAALQRMALLVPVVLAVRTLPGFPALAHDDELGGRLAAEHLLDLGHRRLAQLRGPPDVSSFAGRAQGFRAAARARGVTVLDLPDTARGPTLPEGRRLARLLVDVTPLPTGLFAHNDLMAFGALDVLAEHGLSCPRDVSVVGYNDSPLTDHTDPPLTTVRLPGYELGRLAAEMAVTLIDEPGRRPETLTLSPSLVVRRSTSAV
jgi:LacI family transcriptional regulator